MANDQGITIVPVTERKDLLAFVEFPFRLYRDDPNWVPPLIEERLDVFSAKKNPFYEFARTQLWLARRNGEIVGEIGAVIDDNHNRCHNETTGAFGFFETMNDPAVANALLETAENWVRGQGMNLIRGPLNFSLNQEAALLIDGFDTPPMVMMTHNPRYYGGLIEARGYTKAMDLFAYISNMQEDWPKAPPKLVHVAAKAMQRSGIRIRKVDMRKFDREVELIKAVYNQAWLNNWGFVPMTEHEMDHLAAGLKPMVDPNLILIAETTEGVPVGVSLTLPDLHQALRMAGGGHYFPFGLLKFLWHRRKIDRCRLAVMGVVEQYRHLGIDAAFYAETVREAMARGYKQIEGSWILENNTMMNLIIERLGGKRYKTYRIYEKGL